MQHLSIKERKKIAANIRSYCATLQEIASDIETKESVIDSNCALGASVDLLSSVSNKLNTAAEKEYESKKLINRL